jgi:hypothetical protein
MPALIKLRAFLSYKSSQNLPDGNSSGNDDMFSPKVFMGAAKACP